MTPEERIAVLEKQLGELQVAYIELIQVINTNMRTLADAMKLSVTDTDAIRAEAKKISS